MAWFPPICISFRYLTVALTLFGGVTVDAADRSDTNPPLPRLVIPRLTATTKIDGKLDEPVWKRAQRLTLSRNDRQPGGEATELFLWYDAQGLHLGWKCSDSDIQATFTKRDSRFWEEEVAEFFVTPARLDRYFELQWNPLGGVFDAVITNQLDAKGISQKFDGNWDYTAPGMQSAVVVAGTVADAKDTDQSWVVEVFVPFADLGSVPKA